MFQKFVRITVMLMLLVGIVLPSGVFAEDMLNNVLGIPWGASPEQAREIMAANGRSFFRQNPDSEGGTPMLVFKGPYESFSSFDFFLRFINGQMWSLEASIGSKDDGRLNDVFDILYKQLTQKYGPFTRDESKQYTTKYVWSLNDETIRVTLAKMGTFYFGEEKFDGVVYVTYKNIRLYESLKKKP